MGFGVRVFGAVSEFTINAVGLRDLEVSEWLRCSSPESTRLPRKGLGLLGLKNPRNPKNPKLNLKNPGGGGLGP